jgi:hypothetical protein
MFYSKGETYTFNQQFTEQSEEYKKSHYTQRDADGPGLPSPIAFCFWPWPGTLVRR